MSIQQSLESVNEGTLFVCFCLFWWLVLVALHVDNLVHIPYWAMFIPLWFWKIVVFLGWSIGLITWFRQRRAFPIPPGSMHLWEDPAVPYIYAMSMSTFFALLLSFSEVLLCLHLSLASLQLNYLTILAPLLLVGAFGASGFFIVMIDCGGAFSWTQRGRRRQLFRSRSAAGELAPDEFDLDFRSAYPRHVCSFTMELYIAANMLQLLLLIARLDHWIQSKWIITFIPTFILLGMGFLFCAVGFVVSLIRYFTAFFVPVQQRRIPIRYYTSHVLINMLLCTSVAFLALRLDEYLSPSQISFSLISTPVLLSLVIYSLNAFYMGPGNPWWFGLNRNILLAIFQSFPALQLCVNTSIWNAVGFWKFSGGGRVQHSSMTQSDDHYPTGGDGILESASDLNSHIDAEHCTSSSQVPQEVLTDIIVRTPRSHTLQQERQLEPVSVYLNLSSTPSSLPNSAIQSTSDGVVRPILSAEDVARPD